MFNRENLTIIGNSLKNGVVPSLYAYFNEADDAVTTADFFVDRRLRVGDQIEVISSDYSSIIFYRVSSVTELAGTATVTVVGTNGLSVTADVNGGTLSYNGTVILTWTTGGE